MGFEGLLDLKAQLTKDRILCLVPFDSGRKRGSIVIRKDDGNVRVYTKGAPDVLFGKDAETVRRLTADILRQEPGLDPVAAEARANKQAGYAMVRYAQLAGGRYDDWLGKTTAEGIHSLQEVMELAGNTVPDHEDVFKATVKDYAK